jgi:TolB-like protein/DNA-binding winged helix-turn-helix (wHTH) protein
MTGKRFALGDATFDLAAGRVRAQDGTETELRVQSAEVLRALAGRRGETVTKDELHAAVWGDIAVTDDSLVQCIGDIRRALGAARDAVQTVRGRGYRLAAEGEAVPRAPWWRPRFLAMGALAVIAIAGMILWSLRDGPHDAAPRPAALDGPVVAVLPFENLASGSRWDRLARGVTEEVIADLATNSWIFVLADATTRPHAGATPQAVGAALGAGHVVTGTIQAEGGRVRVTTALSDAASGRQRWTRQWDGPTDDLLAIQAAAAEALVGELAGPYYGAIARVERDRAERRKAGSLSAYELYLRGVGYRYDYPLSLSLAESYLRQAVEVDPQFARAWVALAVIQGRRQARATTEAEFRRFGEKRRAYLAKAVGADPDDPGALIEVAKQAARDGDQAAVARALRRAIALAPNDADILASAARFAPEGAPLGPEAVAWAERALALNPGGPAWYQTALGIALFAVGDDARAAEALASDPSDVPDRLLYLAAAEAMLGHTDRARRAGDRLRELVSGFALAFYMDRWPSEPGIRQRLHDGAVRAGLDAPSPPPD